MVYRPGEVAQVDFFEVTVEVAGVLLKVWKFLLRLMYSGFDFVWLYERCDQLSLLDGHVRAFAYLGGVPQRLVYDNLSAVVRRLVGSERHLTERFTALASHYLFEPCFTRPGEGHDKGGVESRGKAIRLQHMVPIPRGDSLRAISEALLAEVHAPYPTKCDTEGRSVCDRFAEEQTCLRPLPEVPFDERRIMLVPISNKSLVQVEGATYSVPSTWARLEATAYIGIEDIRFCCLDQTVIIPKVQRGVRCVRYRDYLPELAHKPQAVRQVAPELIRELGEPYDQLWQLLNQTHGGREASRVLARILSVIVEHGEPAVTAALHHALASGRCDLLALSPHLHVTRPPSITVPEALRGYCVEASSASDYDWLLEGGAQ